MWEFSTAGHNLPGAGELNHEGSAMVRALAEDLLAADSGFGGRVGLAWGESCPQGAPDGCELFAAPDPWQWLERQASSYSLFWPIFPEHWQQGPELARHALNLGYKLLCPEPGTISLASDKLRCLRYLASRGLNVAPCWSVSSPPPDESCDRRWIRKPRRGAGGMGCGLFPSLRQARQAAGSDDDLLQPYVNGDSCSGSMICSAGRAVMLSGNRHDVAFTGAASPLASITVNQFESPGLRPLGETVARAMPGLHGLVGIDFMAQDDGSLALLEVNPRVTSAYPGLRQALGANPMRWLLPLMLGSAEMPAIPAPQAARAVTISLGH